MCKVGHYYEELQHGAGCPTVGVLQTHRNPGRTNAAGGVNPNYELEI
jgi:hypothetical protein